MAEQEAPKVQNKKLLIVALVLAAVVVGLYQFRVTQIRRAAREEQVTLLKFRRDMATGQQIKSEKTDLERVSVDASAAEGYLKNVVKAGNTGLLIGERVNKPIQQGDWVEWSDITEVAGDTPARKISQGMRARSFPIDPERVPGEMLRTGDRVDVLGRLRGPDGQARVYRILNAVKVLEIGGEWAEQEQAFAQRPAGAQGRQTYRRITVEVTPETSRQLAEVRASAVGPFWIDLINPTEPLPEDRGEINPAVRRLVGLGED